MNYSEIIKDIGKYHFLYVTSSKKAKILATSNLLTEAKKILNNKIKKKLNGFVGIDIIRLKLNKIAKKLYTKGKKLKLITHGGPIEIEIYFYKVGKDGKLIEDSREDRDDKIYITENFLSTNKLLKKHLKFIVKKAFFKKINKGLLSINTIDKILKK